MKKVILIINFCLLPVWYYIIVCQIVVYYWDEATFNYSMGAMHYACGDRALGKLDGEKADRYKAKGNNTLLWIPKFVRPKKV